MIVDSEIAVEAEKGDSRQQIKLNELKEQISRRIVQLEQLYDLHCHDQRISLFHRLKLQLMKALTSKQNHQDDQKRDSLQTMERYSMQASSGRMSERLEPLVDGSLERNPKERKDLKPTQSYKPLQNQTNESNLSERKTSAAYINGKLMLQPTGTQSGAKLKQTAQAKPGKEEKPQPLTDIKKTLNGKRPSHPPKEYPKKGIEPPKKQIAHDKLSEASSSTTHIKPASSFKLLPKEVLPDERMTRPAINLQK